MTPPLVVERHIDAPPAEVYRYLTDAERWVRWQGVDATIDPRTSGIFAMTMGNGMRARGQFVELVPDRRVVFTWGWIDHPGVPPGSTTVEIELEPRGAGTLVVLTHRDLPDDEIQVHAVGWEHYTARLAIVSVGDDPGPDPGPGQL